MNKRKPWNLLALAAALTLLLPAFVWATYPAEVPRTGQTTCYDSSGAVISCAGTGQDGDWLAGVPWPDPRFIDNADGTVTDKLTGLEWTKDANPAGGSKTWQEALDYVKTLNTGGHNDWRMPNVNELESLINAQLNNPALPQGHPFTNVQPSSYWSSTPSASVTSGAFIVDMRDDFLFFGVMLLKSYYIWPVRAGQCGSDNSVICLPKTGQTTCYDSAGNNINITCAGTGQDGDLQEGVDWPDPRFTVNGDAVTDSLTGLVWAKNANLMITRDPAFDTDYHSSQSRESPNDGAVTWQHALDYVAKLNSENYLNHNDWRLPNRRELRSLVDYARYNPTLHSGNPFTNVQTGNYSYWSSTTYSNTFWNAYVVSMGYGTSHYLLDNTSFPECVWPVRAGQLVTTSSSTTTMGATTTVSPTTTVPSTTTPVISSTTTTTQMTTTTTQSASTTTIQPTTTTTVQPTNAKVDMKPETINLKRRAQFIVAIIKLPEGYKAGDVDVESIKLCIEKNAVAGQNSMDLACGDFKPQWAISFSKDSLLVKFPNQRVLDLIANNVDMNSLPAMVSFLVQWNLKNGGHQFEATDTDRVIT